MEIQNLPGLETSKAMAKVCWLTIFSYVLSLVFLFFLLSGFLLRLFCCGLTSSGSETKTMAMKTWSCWSNRTLSSASSCFSSSASLVFLFVFFFRLCVCLSLSVMSVFPSLPYFLPLSPCIFLCSFLPGFFSVCSSLFFLGFSVPSCLSFLVFLFFSPLYVLSVLCFPPAVVAFLWLL